MYDVIVVGARCAGSSLALLLARSGIRVLVLERATFPRDTPNGNAILATGARSLERWGLLERVLATGCPVFRTHTYDFGRFTFTGHLAWPDGSDLYELAPRRYILDTLLADAAAVAGAEVRQGFCVDELVWNGNQVTGIRGRDRDGRQCEERAHLVVGADGFRSGIAVAVDAPAYEVRPPTTCLYFSHWSGVPTDSLEVFVRPRGYRILFPTNDGLTFIGVGWPHSEFSQVRADVESSFMRAIDEIPHLAERVRAGRREERFQGTADLPMFLRKPYGPSWALIGDAGCRVDPITGQGITDAFRDAEFLADAVLTGLGGVETMPKALASFQRQRDAAVLPMYRYTAERAALQPPSPDAQQLLAALVGNQQAIDRFAGLTAGTTSFAEFFDPRNVASIVGRAPAPAA
jgi:2-polyprenyl-6-methoxyphenol hydroxylase-like FAD-dependent oxidoreductase